MCRQADRQMGRLMAMTFRRGERGNGTRRNQNMIKKRWTGTLGWKKLTICPHFYRKDHLNIFNFILTQIIKFDTNLLNYKLFKISFRNFSSLKQNFSSLPSQIVFGLINRRRGSPKSSTVTSSKQKRNIKNFSRM